jgi:hypothetical protein
LTLVGKSGCQCFKAQFGFQNGKLFTKQIIVCILLYRRRINTNNMAKKPINKHNNAKKHTEEERDFHYGDSSFQIETVSPAFRKKDDIKNDLQSLGLLKSKGVKNFGILLLFGVILGGLVGAFQQAMSEDSSNASAKGPDTEAIDLQTGYPVEDLYENEKQQEKKPVQPRNENVEIILE